MTSSSMFPVATLTGQPLKDTGCRNGMYVVGWFRCLQWDPEDDRLNDTPKLTLREAQQQFEKQATALSVDGWLIRSVVLNTALR